MIRQAKSILLGLLFISICIFLFTLFKDGSTIKVQPNYGSVTSLYIPKRVSNSERDFEVLEEGDTIMPELGNATIKAELGRSAWRVIHTMASRFPVKPNQDEMRTFKSFIMLFSRLYPCGQCARHFQTLLTESPPKVESRDAVSQWACEVHNKVNMRLEKPKFNCSEVLSHWKCGCDDVED